MNSRSLCDKLATHFMWQMIFASAPSIEYHDHHFQSPPPSSFSSSSSYHHDDDHHIIIIHLLHLLIIITNNDAYYFQAFCKYISLTCRWELASASWLFKRVIVSAALFNWESLVLALSYNYHYRVDAKMLTIEHIYICIDDADNDDS